MKFQSSKLFFLFIFFVVFTFHLSAKSPVFQNNSKMKILGETATTVTFQEASGKIIEIPKNPERTIVTLNSILDVWYMAEGTSLGRLRGSINVPNEAKAIPVLGKISNINTEKMMELEPDFVICSDTSYQTEIRDFFAKEGVPGIVIDYHTFDDFQVMFDLFTRINNNHHIYEKLFVPLQKEIEGIIKKVPKRKAPSICILFASTRYVKVETQNTITGYFCQKLGAKNIYQDETIEGANRVDLSLEYILEKNPDIIFVTTMGDVEKCQARVEKDIVSSDVWGDLKAVKNNRFIYLDKSYSIYKPNRFYDKAFQIMAEYLYPQTNFK
ncbi:MAG: ABC transporter substrate-binding protein [Spirochaetes bacterium]|nr:ABC transporter substrate-binding protein [Spirochaetota bacterium]